MEKNKRQRILKEETINQVTLEDLLDLGSAAQMAVLKFTDNCMKFNNRHFQQLSTRLNKDLGDLCNMIRQQISTEVDNAGTPPQEQLDSGGMDSSDRRSVLANESENLGVEAKPKMDPLVENYKKVKSLFKQLQEAFGEIEQDESSMTTSKPGESVQTDDTSDLDPTEPSDNVIDLSKAFSSVMEGLSPEQFENFKAELINSLKASGIVDQNYQAIVSEIEKTVGVDDLNYALDSLYDYGDQNGIEINTTVNSEVESNEEEESNEVEEGQPIIPTSNI